MSVKILKNKLSPLIVDSEGFPIPLVNSFLISLSRDNFNTVLRVAYELHILVNWLKISKTEISSLLQERKFFTEIEMSSLFDYCRRCNNKTNLKTPNLYVKDSTVVSRMSTIRNFFYWVLDLKFSNNSLSDKSYLILQQLIDRVFSKKVPRKPSSKLSLTNHALSSTQIENINNYFMKNNTDMVFKRNKIIFLLLLNTGIRAGELLSLRIDDVVISSMSSLSVIRRNDSTDDYRSRPAKVKRNGRIISIINYELLLMLDDYILNIRPHFLSKNKGDNEFLILNDSGDPLSYSSLHKLFKKLSNIPELGLLSTFSPKSLRHTFSSNLERMLRQQGHDENRRRAMLAAIRGDSSLDSQNVYIAQEINEESKKAVLELQKQLQEGKPK